MQPKNSKDALREAVLRYRQYAWMNDEDKSEEDHEKEKRAGFSVITKLLHFLIAHPHDLSKDEQDGLLNRIRKAEIIEPTDTVDEAYNFLAYELVYSGWMCRLFNLPTRDEEEEAEWEKERKDASK